MNPKTDDGKGEDVLRLQWEKRREYRNKKIIRLIMVFSVIIILMLGIITFFVFSQKNNGERSSPDEIERELNQNGKMDEPETESRDEEWELIDDAVERKLNFLQGDVEAEMPDPEPEAEMPNLEPETESRDEEWELIDDAVERKLSGN